MARIAPPSEEEAVESMLGIESKGRIVYGMDSRTIDDWYANPPADPTWLLEGLLTDGGISIVASKPKVGKSTWTRNLAAFIAVHNGFMGKSVRKDAGPVLYFGLEDHPGVVVKHFRGLRVSGSNLIVATGQVPADPWQYLVDHVEKYKPSLVILDPYARFLRIRDWSNYGEVTEATQPLISIARDYGCHVMGTHHMRKQESIDSNGMDEMLGSAQVAGFVDTMILLKRMPDNRRTLRAVQRYGEDTEETFLDFQADSKQFTIGERKFDSALTANADKLFAAMEQGQWYKESDEALKAVVSGHGERNLALSRGYPVTFQRRGKGVKNAPYEYARNLGPDRVDL